MKNLKYEKEFIDILEKHIYILKKITKVYTKNRQDEEDLMNDIVLQLWKSYPGFRGESAISTWIYRVSLNVSLDYNRKSHKYEWLTFVDKPVLKGIQPWYINDEEDNPDIELLYRHGYHCVFIADCSI